MLQNPTYLNDLMNNILAIACECMEETPRGTPKDCFVAHCEPADDCCDFLAVYLNRIRPVRNFPVVYEGPAECNDIRGGAEITVKLVRDCYPVVKDDARNPFPPASAIDAASQDLLMDIWQLRCCLVQAHDKGLFFPDDPSGCNDVVWQFVECVPPRGGCAGWKFSFVVELDTCC